MRTMACKISDSSPKHLCHVSGMRCLPGQIVAAGRRRHWYMVDIAAGAVTRFPRLRNVPDRSLESFAVCRDAKARISTPASVGGTSATAVGCSKSKASACLRYALSGVLENREFSVFLSVRMHVWHSKESRPIRCKGAPTSELLAWDV